MKRQRLSPLFCASFVVLLLSITVVMGQEKGDSSQSKKTPPCTMPAKAPNSNSSQAAVQSGMTPAQARHGAETTDSDCDGISNWDDNCPSDYNPKQTDRNKNGFGDVCEAKRRAQKPSTSAQTTRKPPCTLPFKARTRNPSSKSGRGGKTAEQVRYSAMTSDPDCDGISNWDDNCPSDYNPKQTDRNKNGFGDICEPGRRIRRP